MKKTFIFLSSLFICLLACAQTYKVDLDATLLKNFDKFDKGNNIKISRVIHKTGLDQYGKVEDIYFIVVNSDTIKINDKVEDRLDFKYKSIQDLWDAKIITNVLTMLQKKGIQSELRKEMEEDALEFVNKQKIYGTIFNDPYLENYVYSLVAKIAPVDLVDCRPGNVNILILDNPEMNAGMYPNGTLVLNTGLLSALHTEDELVAILAHEIAHFVLDHSVDNVNKATARKKRAEFWAALATGITAVAEGVAASKGHYHAPGAATLGVAVLSSAIANQVVNRLGMNYNAEQEEEADRIAIQALELLGYNKNALATALNRLKDSMVKERSNAMYFQSYTHPALIYRIMQAGKAQDVTDPDFEREISFAITSVARMKFEDRRFRQVLPLVNQNIHNNVATAEDHILKANCLLALYNDELWNKAVLEEIQDAKVLDSNNINLYKAEILALLRLKRFAESQQLLTQYIQALETMEQSLKDIESDQTWDSNQHFIITERNWAKRMCIKIKGMQ